MLKLWSIWNISLDDSVQVCIDVCFDLEMKTPNSWSMNKLLSLDKLAFANKLLVEKFEQEQALIRC